MAERDPCGPQANLRHSDVSRRGSPSALGFHRHSRGGSLDRRRPDSVPYGCGRRWSVACLDRRSSDQATCHPSRDDKDPWLSSLPRSCGYCLAVTPEREVVSRRRTAFSNSSLPVLTFRRRGTCPVRYRYRHREHERQSRMRADVARIPTRGLAVVTTRYPL